MNELLGPVPAAEPGASFELTVRVEDADAACADLTERGVSIISGRSTVRGDAHSRFLDPDGYVWEFAAEIPSV